MCIKISTTGRVKRSQCFNECFGMKLLLPESREAKRVCRCISHSGETHIKPLGHSKQATSSPSSKIQGKCMVLRANLKAWPTGRGLLSAVIIEFLDFPKHLTQSWTAHLAAPCLCWSGEYPSAAPFTSFWDLDRRHGNGQQRKMALCDGWGKVAWDKASHRYHLREGKRKQHIQRPWGTAA